MDSQRASLHPLDIGLIRGYAIFDFFRTVRGSALFLEDYLTRFINSARKARLPLSYDRDSLRKIIEELIQKNSLEEGGIRMVLSGGISENFFTPSKGPLFIFCESLKLPGAEKYQQGVQLASVDYVRPIAEIKTTNYTLPCLLSTEWAANGIEDVLYHHQGIVSESSRSNVFIVKKGVISTPGKHILKGITRQKVMDLAPYVLVRDITLDEVMQADELFMTSTTKRILPITSVDQTIIGRGVPGPVTQDLLRKFERFEASTVAAT
ncbi:Branched-chain amino acid aminotransferase [Lunatimonas lonarensis]|uniref:branched-chain-amino-acid transaminase n=2 Tax=Lunatimonas lonarensis TaxID=1232681 RepID=R7ZPW3_9BACT|nr:Branched-chain amino acid aminotransferase [Lunatimonas lonarensis]